MLSDQEISAIVDRLWEPAGTPSAYPAIADDVVVYDSRDGAIGVGAAAPGGPKCFGALRLMRLSERYRVAGVDGEACIFVEDVGRPGTRLAGAAGLLLVRDGQISRCEMWFRPRPSGAAGETDPREGA